MDGLLQWVSCYCQIAVETDEEEEGIDCDILRVDGCWILVANDEKLQDAVVVAVVDLTVMLLCWWWKKSYVYDENALKPNRHNDLGYDHAQPNDPIQPQLQVQEEYLMMFALAHKVVLQVDNIVELLVVCHCWLQLI